VGWAGVTARSCRSQVGDGRVVRLAANGQLFVVGNRDLGRGVSGLNGGGIGEIGLASSCSDFEIRPRLWQGAVLRSLFVSRCS
jgi:hypothetical protein